MTTRRSRLMRRSAGIAATITCLFLLIACSNVGAQDTLHTNGPVARKELQLFTPVFWIATVIFIGVEGLIVYMSFRFRERHNSAAPVQVHGNNKLEIGWTIAPAVLLAALAVPTVATIFSLATPAKGANVVHIKVIGHQWWWEYQYDDVKPPVKTATEMVIPTGRPVDLQITSIDVIHSFWIPKLAGKQDAIPNRMSPLTFSADTPGTYYGQCAEFCALSHANMRLRVIAKSPADYQTWLAGQQQDANTGALSDQAAQGAKDFRTFTAPTGSCIGCHTLRGIPGAAGRVGPDLTHVASRNTFAGAILDLTPENLTKWLADPPGIKPGSIMPNYHIPQNVIQELVAFLMTLK